MKKLVLVLIPVTAFLLMFTGKGICDNISNIQLSPSSPASLTFNQNVDITFDYATEEAGGVRIFARPFSSGSLTSNYAAHASPNYPVGSGSGTGYFTITSGDAIVDQIRIRMYNDDQSVLLLEFFIPVEYHFASHSVSNIQLSPSSPAYFTFNQDVDITFDYTTEEAGGVRIFARPFSSGSLTSNYAAHASPNYPVGSGSGTGYFTITSGDAVVDQIRIQMYNDDQSVLLLEFFIPVEYHFGIITDVDLPNTSLIGPKTYFLYQNYPNPFNPVTMINYQLPMSSNVELSIYNLLGQKVATLVSERQPAGSHQVEWDASNMASGIYLYRLSAGSLSGEAEGYVETKKMILMK